jgi:RNA polymerase sigma-70 factor, ECF subfamily
MNEKQVTEITDVDANDEKRLIRLVKEGNQPAFTRLIMLHQKQVFRLAYGFFQDKDDAMEIVQETFIRLYRKIDGYDDNGDQTQFKRWIHRIAYNLCIDYYRKFKKQKKEMKVIYEHDESSRTITTRAEDNLDLRNFRENLKKSAMRLPKSQKTVFLLKHYNGLKHQEISELLDLSVGTIKSLYHQSIKNLKKRLLSRCNIPGIPGNTSTEYGVTP